MAFTDAAMRGRLIALLVLLPLALPAWAEETRPFVKGTYAALVREHAGRPLVVHFWSLNRGRLFDRPPMAAPDRMLVKHG